MRLIPADTKSGTGQRLIHIENNTVALLFEEDLSDVLSHPYDVNIAHCLVGTYRYRHPPRRAVT